MGDDAGIVERGVDPARLLVEVGARDRAESAAREVLVGCGRVAADGLDVPLLELLLPGHPVGPGPLEGHAEDAPELRCVVGLASLASGHPPDDRLRRVAVGQPGHEPGAVEVRVDLELEVDLGPLRGQPQRVVEAAAVEDHRAEHHLVVRALGPAEAARHPGVEEDRDPLVVPAGRGHPRGRQIEIEDRLGVVGDGVHLAAEQAAEEALGPRGLIQRGHVDQLVVHDRVQPLVGRHRLEGGAQGGDLNAHEVARNGGRSGVAGVGEVGEQDRDLLGGVVAEQAALEAEGVLERAHGVGREVGLRALEVDEAQVVGLERGELGGDGHGGAEDKQDHGAADRQPSHGRRVPETERGEEIPDGRRYPPRLHC